MDLITDLARGALIGIPAGGAYALMAVTTTLMYRSTGVLSFASSAFAMIAAYLYGELAGTRGWPTLAALVVALGVTVAYGLAVELLAIRPTRRGSATAQLIATLGVLAFSTGVTLLVFGVRGGDAPVLLGGDAFRIFGVSMMPQQALMLVVAALVAIGLRVLLDATRLGLSVRATAQDAEVSRLMGVSLTRVAQFNWGLGAGLAGLAGILIAPFSALTAAAFPLMLAKALTGSLLGGLASLGLSFAGGITVGAVEGAAAQRASQPGVRELAIFAVVVVFLMVKRTWPAEIARGTPTGLPRFRGIAGMTWARESVSSAVRPLTSRARPLLMLVSALCAAALVVIPASSEYWGYVGARALFYVLEALSLVVLVGWGGQVSLMHGAYVGLGAFGTSFLAERHGVPRELAIPLAAAAGVALGSLAGLPALRLSGLQFAIASLVFSGATAQWLLQRPELPQFLPRGELFGIDMLSSGNLYLVMLVVTAVVYVGMWNLRRSTFGALLIACRHAPAMVDDCGVDSRRARMWAFALASFIATLGGALYGLLVTGFSADAFGIQLSISLLLYTVIGGTESLAGPIIAGALFGVVPELLLGRTGAQASAWPDVVSGIVVVALVALAPSGLASLRTRRRRPRERLGAMASVGWGRFESALADRAPAEVGRRASETVGRR